MPIFYISPLLYNTTLQVVFNIKIFTKWVFTKRVKLISCMHVTEDDDSDSLRSTSSYLFSRYRRDDKNNALGIFMFRGSI